ncbi:MAG: hypothetical protein WD556_13630 [Actinomycetota bacterium]
MGRIFTIEGEGEQLCVTSESVVWKADANPNDRYENGRVGPEQQDQNGGTTLEELTAMPGGSAALARWEAKDDSVWDRLSEQELGHLLAAGAIQPSV